MKLEKLQKDANHISTNNQSAKNKLKKKRDSYVRPDKFYLVSKVKCLHSTQEKTLPKVKVDTPEQNK